MSEGFDVVVSHLKKMRYIAEARIKSDRLIPRLLLNWRGWMRCICT